MKYFFLRIFLTISLILVFFTSAHAQSNADWSISHFHSDIAIQPDGNVVIKEQIDAKFNIDKHGVFRKIPVVYTDSANHKTYTSIEVNSVTNHGQTVPFKTAKKGDFLEVKIGDPNRTITGAQLYQIEYTAKGILRSFNTYDELYWNITGNEWDVAIPQVTAKITLPQGGIQQIACYEGSKGSSQTCNIEKISDKSAFFSSTRSLGLSEGLTVGVGYTKGMVPILTVPQPTYIPEFLKFFLAFFGTLIPGSMIALFLWIKKGRDLWWERKNLNDPNAKIAPMPLFGVKETIAPEFAPPGNLRPAEMGVLIDESADTIDISSTIVDLAVRGYITIHEVEKKGIKKLVGGDDYTLKRTEKTEEALLSYEKTLLHNLFAFKNEVSLSELKNSFYTHIDTIKNQMYNEVTAKKLFVENPKAVQDKYKLYGFIFVAIAVIGYLIVSNGGGLYFVGAASGGGLTAVVYMIVSTKMSQRTADGHELFRRVRGYQLFLSSTEKYRQPFFEKENIFMEVLPYAILFGLTKKLAESMKEMGIKPPQPDWYVGTRPFNVASFGTTMDSFSTKFAAAAVSTPSGSGSGGGGFSGGGFGGGGGGSW